ncbi:MAG: PQQ-binding-like beta-propeller repeat protein [Solirubrobacteraceae bacterium]
MRAPLSNRGLWIVAGLLGLVAAVVVVYAVHKVSSPSSSLDRTAPFVAPPTTTVPSVRGKKTAVDRFSWPFYGGQATRTRDFTGEASLNPPLRETSSFGGNALLEFPATIYGRDLYFLDGGATAKRVNMRARGAKKLIWMTHLGKRSASSPALDPKRHELFVTVLSTVSKSINSLDGEMAALSMKNGKVLWTYRLPSGDGSESSPIVIGNSVYFGDADGTLRSLNVVNGHENWARATDGAIKAGPAYADGNLYFGTYGGTFYAINAKTGAVTWSTSPGGEFYSTPAIAFGRVYVGNNNGDAYSFVLSNGTEAWSQSVGGYAYSGPAVADLKGLGPTVYIGSYDEDLYALNARTGSVEWASSVGSAISGSATVINNTVYVSTVYHPGSYGFNAVTGKQVFSFDDGSYTTVVADRKDIYLMGRYVLYKFVPKR